MILKIVGPPKVRLSHRAGKSGDVNNVTDEYASNVTSHLVHDIQPTIMWLLRVDHTSLTYRYQGRQFRLTDGHSDVAAGILR